MNLLVLGGSGGIGGWLVRLAVRRGHRVTALVRPSARLEAPAGARVVRGAPTDRKALTEVLGGQDAVLSAIGQRRTSFSPWSTILSPHDIVEQVTRAVVAAMHLAGVQRLIFVSAGGVGDSVRQCTGPIRWMITRPRLTIAYADLARAEQIAAQSSLDWLAVRPVTLTPFDLPRPAHDVRHYGLFSSIGRKAVAEWMLDAVERTDRYTQHTVLLGS